MPISLRVHTEVLKGQQERARKTRKKTHDPKWPEYALVFDCETTIDELQTLIIGAYRFCWAGADGHYDCIEEGFFYADDLPETDPAGFAILRQFVKEHPAEALKGFPNQLRLLSRSEFMEQVFWRAAGKAGALVVGFNLPFDLSRLAMECRKSKRRGEVWSFLMFQDKDPKTGRMREHPFLPWIKVTPKDSKVAFIRFTGVSIRSKKTGKRLVRYTPGRFLDLRTLGWALRNESYSLESACRTFGVPGKLSHDPSGHVSLEELEYCRQDVRATVSLLNAMRTEFDRHPIEE